MSKGIYFINESTGDYNLEVDIDLAEECIDEVNSLKCNKVKFMNSKIEERLNKCNNIFMEDFNSGMNDIMKILDEDEYSSKNYLKLMKKINKAMSESQRSFLIILKELSILNKEDSYVNDQSGSIR